MRKLLFLLSLIPFIVNAQVWQQNNLEPGYQFKGLKATRALLFPLAQTTAGQGRDTGAVYYKIADSSVYAWTGSQWRLVGGGSVDSSVFATRYYAQQTFVPYTGATGSVNLGLWGLTTDRFVFNQTPTLAGGERIMRWNDTDGTFDVGMKGGNVTLQVGQELHIRARNNTGSTILNGQAVYISGSTGTNTTIALAKADAVSTSKATIGIATEDIPNGQSGFVTPFGKVRDLNTTGLTEGGLVYLSSTVAGSLTSTAPTGDTYPIIIGVCEKVHATQGVIFVRVDKEYVRQYEIDSMRTRINTDLNGKQGALTLTTTGSSGASTLIGNTLNIPQYSGGGSADSTYQTVEIGTAVGKIGNLVNEPFSGGSIPAGWTKGGSLGASYAGGKLTVTGATSWGPPESYNNTDPWLSAFQYDTERMPWEKQSGYIDVVPQTKSDGAIIALTHGSNGALIFSARETVAWDLSNGTNSGRVVLGTDSITTFTTLQDSTEKMSFSATDSLRLYWEKDGWNVTAGIINKTTGRKTAVKFGQIWNGIGGRFNFVFLNGTYDVTRIRVDANDRVGGTWFVGHSRVSGTGATSEQNRYANLVFNSNYKYFGVMGLPAVSSEEFLDGGITEEVINRAAPDYVVLDLFSNDLADAGRTPAQVKVYADSIGSRFSRSGSDVNILGQFVAAGSLASPTNILNDSLYNLCVERGWTFIDIDTALLTATGGYVKPRYSNDGVHWNDSGQVINAQKIRAKIGFKIFQEVVADTTYKIKFHGLENATFKNGYKVLVADNQGRVGTVPNQFLNPSQYIQNKYSTNGTSPQSVAQENSWIHVSGPINSDSALMVRTSQGLRIGFNNDDATATTGANIDITNAGVSGVGYPQAFDNITGYGNVKIVASSGNKTKGTLYTTISGTNNSFLNAQTGNNFSGHRNTLISAYEYAGTSGDDNIGIGAKSLSGLTTGSGVINLDNGSPLGTTPLTSSLSYAILIGDGATDDPYVTGDISFNPKFMGSVARLWVGGRSSRGTTSEIHGTSNKSGANVAGPDFSLFLGRGTGTNVGGKFMLRSWDATGSGSTLQSTASTELTVFNKRITVENRFQTSTGANVASANDLTLGNDGNVFHITGTTQINAITTTNWQAGSEIILIFDASVTVKNNTAGGANTAILNLAGAADFSATALDVLKLIFDGTSWYEVSRSVN